MAVDLGFKDVRWALATVQATSYEKYAEQDWFKLNPYEILFLAAYATSHSCAPVQQKVGPEKNFLFFDTSVTMSHHIRSIV